MKMIRKIILLFLVLVLSVAVFAQDTKTGAADLMRSNGRIYVVVAVVLTILIGLLVYIVRLDRKMTKLEKDG